jgi:alkylhydroperoxidase family enzyme
VPLAGCVRRTYGCRSFRDTISAYILCGRRPDPVFGHDGRHQDAHRDPAHAGPVDEERSFLKGPFLSVWCETGQTFSTQERAALEWAETLTLISETHAPEEIYRDIAAHFTEKEMVDLTIAIGLMNVFNRIAIGFGCDPASS